MAALVAGVQYGLSTQSNFHENKSLIFVKLTDSAQRAIEDFLENRNKISQNPTIQFSGSEGKLSFPSTQSSNGTAKFVFTLSSNTDIEGPQGSFECVQQTDTKNLESLGALPCRMRIQANDDVYEKTRHRMAVCEENNKIKATKVIKSNGLDIGRKIKVKTSGKTLTSLNRHREQSSIPTSVSQSSRLPASLSSSHLYNNFSSSTALTSSSSLSSSLSSLSSSSTSSVTTTTTTTTTSSSFPVSSSLSNASNTTTSTNNYRQISSNPQVRTHPDKKLSELARRPLRERLIHVLALRTYKKVELHDRITREGYKERDKSTMTMVLKQIATMHNNEYHLHRHVWNDVQEDWPFYSDQDRAMLKRRKPQNLTPPGSSDGGSSGSGQSPNSTHPGSPPAISAPPPPTNQKRPGFSVGNDGLQTKRPRISHYRKPDPSLSSSSSASMTNNYNYNNTMGTTTTVRDNTRITNGNGNSNSDNVFKGDCENQSTTRGHNNHRNTNSNNINNNRTNTSDMINNRSYGMDKLSLGLISDNEDINQHTKYNNNNNNNHHYHQQQQSMITGKNDNNSSNGDGKSNGSMYVNSPNCYEDSKHDRNNYNNDKIGKAGSSNDRYDRKDKDYGRNNNDKEQRRRERDNNNMNNNNNELSNFGASNNSNNMTPPVIPSLSPNVEMIEIPEYPDYRTEFPPIANEEQRLRYKKKFNEDYEEYRKLHTYIAQVPSRFADLEVRRRRERENQESREAIEKIIIAEYIATKNNRTHIEAKNRFNYLHEKLSHIRNKVDEYDAQIKLADNRINNENNGTMNNSEGIMNGGDLRY